MTLPNEILIAEALIAEMEYIRAFAKANQTCKRKSVGVSILDIVRDRDGRVLIDRLSKQHNGPVFEAPNTGPPIGCTNEVGNCGCAHAEPRALLDILKRGWNQKPDRGKLIMVSEYSPCTNCANIIIDSRVISVCVYDIVTKHDLRGLQKLQRALDCTFPLEAARIVVAPQVGEEERCLLAAKTILRWLD